MFNLLDKSNQNLTPLKYPLFGIIDRSTQLLLRSSNQTSPLFNGDILLLRTDDVQYWLCMLLKLNIVYIKSCYFRYF